MTTCQAKYKVTLLGASGGIGQPLAMLLKMNKYIKNLALYDITKAATPCPGVAADISHINSPCLVKGYHGDDQIQEALSGADVVVITAGVPRKPGMTRDDLFNINAKIVKGLMEACAKYSPNAVHTIISNPVNSTVPIACEVMMKAGVFDYRKILGVTTLDSVRASTFVAAQSNLCPSVVNVPVVGGHAGETILPLLSQTSPPVTLSAEDVSKLDKHIQDAGTEVVEAKGGAGSATLSMAYAANRFTESLLRAMCGEKVVECCYYKVPDAQVYDGVEYFSTQVELSTKGGIEKVHELGPLSQHEKDRLVQVKSKLKGDIKNGVDFGRA